MMDGPADLLLLSLLPEIQEALSEEFDGIECGISPGPLLTQSPFRQAFPYLGQNITYVPDLAVSCIEDSDVTSMFKVLLSSNSAVFTDGQAGCCLELALGRGKDWRAPLIKLFNRLYPTKWSFFVAELEQSQPTFHILSHDMPIALSSIRREDSPDSMGASSQVSSPPESVAESTNFSLWIVPVTRILAIPPPKKTKIVKKIVKKRSPSATVLNGESPGLPPNGTNGTNGSTNTLTVNGLNGIEEKEKKIRVVKKVKKEKSETTPEREVATPDTLAASGHSSSASISTVNGSGTRLAHAASNGNAAASTSNEVEEENSSLSELRKKLLDASERSEDRFQVNGEIRRIHPLRPSLSRKSMTPDRRLDPIYEAGSGRKDRHWSPSKEVSREVLLRSTVPSTPFISTIGANSDNADIPYVALQLVLGRCFSYAQLGRLREVHPHWDELAGQMLNRGYYNLLERSDHLLMALQRKLPSEPHLHYPTSVLTNIQVHILNPVDIMRAVLDEGVCCFPYGTVLDKTFIILDRIEAMLYGGEQSPVEWESVAILAKKAQQHYRGSLEKTMEDRLGENLRLKAAQRIIRLDSFMVESSVNKLEKDASKARDDLKWEIEQLQQQNAQLKKDNRQLKQEQMKLDARVDILESKFKTLARLLG